MTRRAPARNSSLGRAQAPWVVLVGTLLISLAAAEYVRRSTLDSDRQQIAFALRDSQHEIRGAIRDRIDTYVGLLRGAAGLFGADPAATAQQFHEYVTRLRISENYPGVRGIGFAPRLLGANAATMQAELRDRGLPGVKVWPDSDGEHFPVLYLEPADEPNGLVMGYDMFTDPTRRAAMERARDTAMPAASGKVTLKQDPGQPQPGFLIFIPLYRNGIDPGSIALRRQNLAGFVYSAFRTGDLLRGIDESSESLLDFSVYDGTEISEERHLHHTGIVRYPQGMPTSVEHLDVAGRTWTVHFGARPNARPHSAMAFASIVFAGGAVFAFALFLLITAQLRARHSAETSAAELRASEADRSRLLAAEREARAEAEAANQTKDEFLATLSHELRTPLNAILGWAQLLRMGDIPADELEHGLETIERNAKVQAQLVEDLLDLSRIISGKLRLELRTVDLPLVIDAALDSVRPAAEAKRIQLVPILDASASPVRGDSGRLQQVVWNLLSNAIKFTPVGGRVELLLQRVDGHAEVAVCDTGIGINPEFLPYVFDRLRQADSSSTRRHGGLGLGLAIVRHLVESHGGTVRAQSHGEGHGATFTVSLPLAKESLNRSGGDPATPDRRRRLNGVRVLVVDDEPDARELVSRILKQDGAEVRTAAGVAEALGAIDESCPDALVSDIAMPVQDGYDLIRQLRSRRGERAGEIPAVALTAFARPEDRKRALEAGFQVHLAKPVEPAELLSAVASLRPVAHGSRN